MDIGGKGPPLVSERDMGTKMALLVYVWIQNNFTIKIYLLDGVVYINKNSQFLKMKK